MPPHCDTLDGPIVRAAQKALNEKNVDLVLPYVYKEGEKDVEDVFNKVMAIRGQNEAVREIADRYFFETVVRIHRAGEGAAYTGLKPAGLSVGPIIPVAEKAIETGSPQELVGELTSRLKKEIEERYAKMLKLKKDAGAGVDQAREYVEAMLGLQVYSHKIYLTLISDPHEKSKTGGSDKGHEHDN